MPLTDFQKLILRLLKDHRTPTSYIAGGVAINRLQTSGRYSSDIDFFHDIDEAVTLSAKFDIETLRKNDFSVQILLEQPSFWRVVVSKGNLSLKLEWVRDTAYKFFPVIDDPELGFRLHDADLAVNKCLALANRNEVRDILDLIQLHQTSISLVNACWGACGKDPGFSPPMLIDCMRRNSIIRPEVLEAEDVTRKVSPTALKSQWLAMLKETEDALTQLPAQELGCLYVDSKGEPLRSFDRRNSKDMHRHLGTIGGSWPQLVRE